MFENHNICLKEIKGDYVLLCHSNDTLYDCAMKILYKKISEREFPKKYIIWGIVIFEIFKMHC